MANTFTQIYLQFVFAVQDRISLIGLDWKDRLYKYIAGIIRNNNHKLIAINGIPNHIHVFIGYNPNQLVPDLLQDIKGDSSRWINEEGLVRGQFRWQQGYGAFSYSHSQIDAVATYIMNQEKHHKKKTFREEYIRLLQRFRIDFDEQYILKDVQK
ncbi:MAG: IS200/IS605 family transposase [FCB group bacterium]|nr:IS200/IS605 family transposase [FCB group bacterium]